MIKKFQPKKSLPNSNADDKTTGNGKVIEMFPVSRSRSGVFLSISNEVMRMPLTSRQRLVYAVIQAYYRPGWGCNLSNDFIRLLTGLPSKDAVSTTLAQLKKKGAISIDLAGGPRDRHLYPMWG